jgi:antitoxin component of RelBE/YafQ-DinJ toxin-antitoxin module
MAAGVTPQRVIRIDNPTWAAYGAACEAKGISRSDDIRMHVKAVIAEHEREQRRAAREA